MKATAFRIVAVSAWALLAAAASAQEAPGAPGPTEPAQTVPLKLVRADPDDRDVTRYSFALVAQDPEDFPKVQAGKGIVNAKAVVARFRMRNGKTIMAVYDADKPDQFHPEVLRVDLSGEGDFTKAVIVPRTGTFDWMGTPGYRFLAKEATIETGQASVPVSIASQLIRGDRQAEATLLLAWYAQGLAELAGKRVAFRLLDADYNFRLGDAAKAVMDKGRPVIQKGDTLQIDFVRDTFQQFATLYLGSPIGLYGKLYEATVSPDLKTISLAPYKGPTATLHIDQPRWTAHLLGENGVVSLLGDRTPMPVPPGKYRVRSFTQYSEDGYKDRRHEFHVVDPGYIDGYERPLKVPELVLDLKPGQNQEVRIGSPLTASLTAVQDAKGLMFELVQWDASDRQTDYMVVWGYSGFSQVPELTVEILDAGGTSIDKVAISTIQATWTSVWTPPAGLKGQFAAKLRYRNDAFGEIKIVQPRPFDLVTTADGRIEKFTWRGADIPGAESKPPADSPLPKEGVGRNDPPPATAPAATAPVGAPESGGVPAVSTKPAADARARQWLAMARNYQAAGMKDKAREFLERIIAECPDSDEAKTARLLLGP